MQIVTTSAYHVEMKKLTIDESRWACGSLNNGTSALLNSRGSMCCLGFLAVDSGFTRDEIGGILTPSGAAIVAHSAKNLPKGIVYDAGLDDFRTSEWTDEAMVINDQSLVPHDVRKRELTEHLKRSIWS